MQEYKFRGKRVDNGEWVYGSLIDKDYILQYIDLAESWTPLTSDHKVTCRAFAIIPETVGVWTGLKDKNGKGIYEGDIILTQPYTDKPYAKLKKSKRHHGQVVYKIGKHESGEYYSAEWSIKITDEGEYGCHDWGAFYNCEVVDNIHDNPELLNPLQRSSVTNTMYTDPNAKTAEVTEQATEQESAGQQAAQEAAEANESAEEGTTEG